MRIRGFAAASVALAWAVSPIGTAFAQDACQDG
jgi:hypothetical protein